MFRVKFYKYFGKQILNERYFSKSKVVSCKKEKDSVIQNPENPFPETKPSPSIMESLSSKEVSYVELHHRLAKDYDISFKGLKNYFRKLNQDMLKNDQVYLPERVAALGNDLAVAHFIIYRGGRIRFKGSSNWIKLDKDIQKMLPMTKVPGYYVEAIEFGDAEFVYEGIESIGNLLHLRHISFAHSSKCNDWMMDSIAGNFGESLEYLDISYCSGISERGVACIGRMRNLHTVNLEGLDHIKSLKLLSILLEESLPGLVVKGVTLENEELDSSASNIDLLPEDIQNEKVDEEFANYAKEKYKSSLS